MTLKMEAESVLPTQWGEFLISCVSFSSGKVKQKATVIKLGEAENPLLCRVHSQCLTGESFGSLRCDCKDQLDASLKMIQEQGAGAVFYLEQEGRGIGLENKIKAYALQDKGLDTLDANLSLGLPADDRDYSIVPQILEAWNVERVKLLTNCLLYTSPSPRDRQKSRMPSSA